MSMINKSPHTLPNGINTTLAGAMAYSHIHEYIEWLTEINPGGPIAQSHYERLKVFIMSKYPSPYNPRTPDPTMNYMPGFVESNVKPPIIID